ncbi:MAG: PilW family protein [Phycisphaerales bacterium JB060]
MTRYRQHHGVSLVELLVGIAMSATVLGGAVAAIGLSGRTFRMAAEGLRSGEALDAIDQFSADIRVAISFSRLDTNAVAFRVPDRTGDGGPELVEYEWSGTPGDPLVYSMNGSTPVELIAEVTDLNFDYLVANTTGQPAFVGPAPPPPSDEMIFERAYEGTATAHTLGSLSGLAAIIQPRTGDSDHVYRITRVLIPMSGAGAGPGVTVSLHRVNMTYGTPESSVLSSVTVSQSELPATMSPVEFRLPDAPELDDGTHIAIVVMQGSGGSGGQVALETSPSFLSDGWIAIGTPGSWSLNGSRDMPLELYAEVREND